MKPPVRSELPYTDTKPQGSADFYFAINATFRYRDRSREYESGTRSDDRDQWLLRATFRQSDRLAWTGSYSREQTSSSDPGRGSFETDVLYAGLIVGF